LGEDNFSCGRGWDGIHYPPPKYKDLA